ncbi:MAG: sigma 54-interacting transcriptional regulator [Planctomycetia bacterium]|nr:sigma 54-interacting transcriptional regulator [Planctomycetia bacterium]
MVRLPVIPTAGDIAVSDERRSGEGEGIVTLADDDVAALRAILDGTARTTGREFFQSLVRHLAQAVGVRYAFIAEFAGATRVRTLAYWFRDRIIDNVEWDLAGTPCEDVVRGRLCHHPTDVKVRFPGDRPLVDLGIESYLGVPLCDVLENHLGHLAVFDDRPMPAEPRRLYTFQIFAARAAAELERLAFEKRLSESEKRFRDLYDEAPIAYVKEDLESRFISANRAALRILGIKPEEVAGMVGMSLVPDTPDAQKRVKDAFASIGRGTDTNGVVLELRRKDNGKPIWIQWWSRPEPDGKYTRTMFVDITERVLAEQEKARLTAQNLYLQEEIKSAHNFEEIVGQSAALTRVLSDVSRVAATDATVLIVGETGTGKELIARAIHSASRRKDKPLIKINCAALPAGLIESELFGHEKGAFSGAIARRTGRFELADGGTIFLDEIGELPPDAQAKLLRVLQEREFDRVGGGSPIKVDVRVIAATNRDLLQSVRDKDFRADLFYRLNVFPLRLPPLRERADDIPLLVHFLVGRFAGRIGKRIESVSRETMKLLVAYPWPGNVRELENVLERAVILSSEPMLEIDPEVLPVPPDGPAAPCENHRLEDVQRSHIRDVLDQTNWVIEGARGAALVLGLHPNTLRSRMKKLGLVRGSHDNS